MNLRTVLWEARVVAGAVLLTVTAGCYSMQRVPARLITTEKPSLVVVRDADGAIFAINSPTIVADSLVGDTDGERTAINLREVDAMVVRKYNKAKTIGFAAGMTGLAGFVVAGAIVAGIGKDCPRVANRNSACLSVGSDCKYDACDEDNAIASP